MISMINHTTQEIKSQYKTTPKPILISGLTVCILLFTKQKNPENQGFFITYACLFFNST